MSSSYLRMNRQPEDIDDRNWVEEKEKGQDETSLKDQNKDYFYIFKHLDNKIMELENKNAEENSLKLESEKDREEMKLNMRKVEKETN